MLQVRSPASQIKTLQLALAVATLAHTPLLSNGHVLIPTDNADANAINGFTYEAEISDAPKAAVAWAALDKLYWDDTNKVVTNVATANTLIGYALEASAAGDATTGLIAFNAFAA
ncbi:MAG TPA: DUF2190 family protein [Frateuria sp.]|uniref:DUF2190 family protein n=1 Tax=Frateuria sp. TaxID=2211372 RepID=UPI002D7FCDB4|nr:DUF2190 family protein [Frateuria sp.]HET6805318.1 DUF2190 family protein [Frateuria sp.]